MKLFFNGEPVDVPKEISVADLLSHFKLKKEAVVTELNGSILDKSLIDSTFLSENDKVECILFMAGG